jgi:6-hydroxycyclohex-1-ene-1-carbonyl-CoA dehydrogenase
VTYEPPPLELVGIAVEAMQPSGAAVGRVDDASEGSAILLGKRVLVGPLDPCGQCEVCRRGGAAVCPFAKRREISARLRVASRWVVALGDGLELPVPAAAAVAGDVATAYTLYARTGLAPRDPVVIVGDTAVARFLVEIVRAKGITPTVIASGDESWRSWLLAKGAAVVRGDDGDDAVRDATTAAIAAQGLGVKPWRVIATSAAVLARAAALTGPRATLTAYVDGKAPALPAELLAREVTVIGVAGPHPDLIVEAAALCVKGDIDLAGGVAISGGDVTRATVIPS